MLPSHLTTHPSPPWSQRLLRMFHSTILLACLIVPPTSLTTALARESRDSIPCIGGPAGQGLSLGHTVTSVCLSRVPPLPFVISVWVDNPWTDTGSQLAPGLCRNAFLSETPKNYLRFIVTWCLLKFGAEMLLKLSEVHQTQVLSRNAPEAQWSSHVVLRKL